MRTCKAKTIHERLTGFDKFSRSLEPPFPKDMLIELTNACNNKCIFCANAKMTRKVGHISLEILDKVLSQAYALGARNVGFYTTGEPFISNKLPQCITMAKRKGFTYIYLTTNGVLAIPSRVREVIDTGLDSLKFSINAGTRKTYEEIHGRDDFDKVIANLKYASEYRKKVFSPLTIHVSYVITRKNEREQKQFRELVAPYTDDVFFLNVSNQGGMMPEIKKELVPENPNREFTYSKKVPCSMVFNRLHVTCEGYVSACCVDFQNNLVVADLNKVDLSKAWRSQVFKKLRRLHLENRLQGTQCYNCVYDRQDAVEPLLPEYAAVPNVLSKKRKDAK